MPTKDEISENLVEILEKEGIITTSGNPLVNIRIPIIGKIKDNEIINITSLRKIQSDVFRPQEDSFEESDLEKEINDIIKISQRAGKPLIDNIENIPKEQFPIRDGEPCAWYCPIHFFGRN